MSDDTTDLTEIARDMAEAIVERAENAGYESTADEEDLAEFAKDIETWLRGHMQGGTEDDS